MSIEEHNAPIDHGGKPMSAIDVSLRMIAERMPGILKTERLRNEHKKRRTLQLARKMHQVGAAILPLPNLAAYTEIERLEYDDENPFDFVAECIFILANQQNETVLFLTGIERRKAIYESCKLIHAHNAPEYMICIREMQDEIKKKLNSSEQAIRRETISLTQRISSLLSAKPLDTQPATS